LSFGAITGTALPDGFVTEEGRRDLEAYAAEITAGTKLLPVFNTGAASSRHLLQQDQTAGPVIRGEFPAVHIIHCIYSLTRAGSVKLAAICEGRNGRMCSLTAIFMNGREFKYWKGIGRD
jgi:hypothetical protein